MLACVCVCVHIFKNPENLIQILSVREAYVRIWLHLVASSVLFRQQG